MKKSILIPAALIIAAMFTCSAFAADGTKIGVINFDKILQESSAGKVMLQDLKAKRTQLQKKLQGEEKKYGEMKTALENEALVLSAEKRIERQREIRNKASYLENLKTDSNQDMQLLRNRRMNQIQKDVFGIANKIGKAKGYLMIIEKKIGGVIYAADKVDITDEVIKEYNSTYAKIK